jgi:putative hydroxymethylpyrimidine transporter CytX
MNDSSKNNLSFSNFSTLWFGAAVSIAEILTGALLAPLGFLKGTIAILVGHAIGVALLVLGGVIGYEQRIPSIMSTRISFGKYGSYIFSVFNMLQLIGWTAVMIIVGGRSLNVVSQTLWSFNSLTFWSILIGVLVCGWIFMGSQGLKRINTVAVLLLFILTIVLSVLIFKNKELFTKEIVGSISFGTALEYSIIMPLSWLPLIADYTRFGKSKKGSIGGSFLGYFVGSSWMYVIGLGSAIVYNNSEIGAIMVAANLGIVALGIIVLATVTTTFMDVYSAGVSFLNINSKANEKLVAIVLGIVGTLLALYFPIIEQYQDFLYAIGSVFAPLFAVLFTDYFLLKKGKSICTEVLINWAAFFAWGIGVVLYYKLLNLDMPIGTTVPVMILTAILYFICEGWFSKWKYVKKFQN